MPIHAFFRLFADKGKEIDGDSFFFVSGRVWNDRHMVVLGYPQGTLNFEEFKRGILRSQLVLPRFHQNKEERYGASCLASCRCFKAGQPSPQIIELGKPSTSTSCA
jgi:hypothetical protein